MKLALSLPLLIACIYMAMADELTFVVTPMIGSEDSYLQLKRRVPSLRPPREEKLKRKEDICLGILADEFFDAHKVEMVNPNHKSIYKQVKQQHPDIHDDHFKTGISSEVIKPKFANPYKPRDVNVHGSKVREYTFTCLAKNCSTKNIHQYFVSPVYVVNEGSPKRVRFVFAYDGKKEMSVLAKAEEKFEEKSDSQKTETASVKPTSAKTTSAKTTEPPSEESSYEEDSDESESW